MIYALHGFLHAMLLHSGQFCLNFVLPVLGEECRKNWVNGCDVVSGCKPTSYFTYLLWSCCLLRAQTPSQGGGDSKSPRNGYCCTTFCSLTHPVFERAPPILPGVFIGQIPPRQDWYLLPWCGCEKGIAEYYSRELDNTFFISRTMQPFSELNKHFAQQCYPWQYCRVARFHGLSRLSFSPD